jgi:hypothetical protein
MSLFTDGRWSGDLPAPGDSGAFGDGEGVFVIHATLMHTGKVLWFSGHTETSHYLAESYVWDPTLPISTATRQPFPASTDVFCCHQANLDDGRVITIGGARAHPDHGQGIRAICIFDPATSTWSQIGELNEARWYPTLVTLPDGRLLAFSGRRASGESTPIAETVEVLSPPFQGPGYTTRTVIGGTKVFPTYPGMHLIRGGRIIHTGPTWRYEFNATVPIGTVSLRVTGGASGAWTDEGVSPQVDFREEGMSVLLPPAQAGRILLIGGGKAHFSGGNFASLDPASQPRSAEILDTQTSPPAWTRIADMSQPRINGSAVLLPDGKVLALGGHNRFKFEAGSTPSLPAEIYDPVANTWHSAGAMSVPRMYHSAHLLLPDARVLCAGGFDPNLAGDHNRKSFEFYEPPYFFNPDGSPSPRPTITGISREDGPDDVLAYGREFFIHTPNAGSIAKVALMRPGAMTHHTDSEQRYVAVEFIAEPGNGRLRALATPDATIAPPGWYMLWIVDTNNRPCARAPFVRLQREQFYIITDRSTFSKDEIAPAPATTTFENSFYVVMDGLLPADLSINPGTPFQPPPSSVTPTLTFTDAGGTSIPQISAVVRELLVEIPSIPAGIRQRFVLRYAVDIRGTAPFFQSDGTTPIENRQIVIRAVRGEHVGFGTMRLTHQPNPYTFDGPKPWLSVDLRVFKVLDGDTRFGQPPLNPTPSGAVGFIQGVLALLRTTPGTARAQFESLPTEAEASQLDIAESRDGRRVYNFAIAQVRYRGRTLDATDVRVFFRLFTTAATGMEFRPETYATVPNVDGHPIPVLGQQGGLLATIPFFAEPRVNPGDPLTLQRDPFNRQTIVHNPSGAETTWYFGCWLDFNQSAPGRFPLNASGAGPFFGPLASLQQLIRGRHQCLVAELFFGPDPTPVLATPGNNDNLAQRNLAILETDNPGGPATRTVQHTFEIKPSPTVATFAPSTNRVQIGQAVDRRGFVIERPDELMFRWGNLPRETEVTLYFPSIPAEEILQLAMQRNTWGQLELVDPHTIRCLVGGVTFVPLPGNRSTTIPGLISMVLPAGIRRDNRFHVVVHQAAGVTRAILGAFEIAIHVSKAALLLAEEKRTLSVMRHIALAIPPDDRWHPIFVRYLRHLAERVHGFGGNPDRVEPSPSGDPRPRPTDPDDDPCCDDKAWACCKQLGCLALGAGVGLVAAWLARRRK